MELLKRKGSVSDKVLLLHVAVAEVVLTLERITSLWSGYAQFTQTRSGWQVSFQHQNILSRLTLYLGRCSAGLLCQRTWVQTPAEAEICLLQYCHCKFAAHDNKSTSFQKKPCFIYVCFAYLWKSMQEPSCRTTAL